jgi:hypothetical protein
MATRTIASAAVVRTRTRSSACSAIPGWAPAGSRNATAKKHPRTASPHIASRVALSRLLLEIRARTPAKPKPGSTAARVDGGPVLITRRAGRQMDSHMWRPQALAVGGLCERVVDRGTRNRPRNGRFLFQLDRARLARRTAIAGPDQPNGPRPAPRRGCRVNPRGPCGSRPPVRVPGRVSLRPGSGVSRSRWRSSGCGASSGCAWPPPAAIRIRRRPGPGAGTG